jgi:hypothetical protein
VRPSCDRSAELRSSVGAYLGRDAFEDGAPLTIRISVRRASGASGASAILADVSKLDRDGNVWGVRTVSGGDSCETLDEPLTLVVALMLDSGKVSADPETALKADQPRTPAPAARRETGTTSSAVNSDQPPTEPGFVLFGAGIGTALGQLPFPNYGARLQVVFKPRRFWGLEISAEELTGASSQLPGSGSIDFRILKGALALCPLESIRDRVWLSGCVGVELAWVGAESRGLLPHRRRTEVVPSPVLRVQLGYDLGRGVLLGSTLAALFPISPNRYTFRDAEGENHLAFQMASPGLAAGLLLAFRVP